MSLNRINNVLNYVFTFKGNTIVAEPSLLQTRSRVVYRFTAGNGPHSNPQGLKALGGFQPRGQSESIGAHRETSADSVYISTSHSALKRFSGVMGYGHVMQIPPIYVDVLSVHDYLYPLSEDQDKNVRRECEIAALRSPYSDLIASRKIMLATGYYGDLIVNPDFKLRNFSIQILSASDAESDLLEKAINKEKKEDLRYLKRDEAEILADVLTKESNNYQLQVNSPFIFVGSDRTEKFERMIPLLADHYNNIMQQNGVTLSRTNISFFSANKLLIAAEAENKENQDDTPKIKK